MSVFLIEPAHPVTGRAVHALKPFLGRVHRKHMLETAEIRIGKAHVTKKDLGLNDNLALHSAMPKPATVAAMK
jgi:hypothetical protein